jgi:hypothetical protein
LFGVWTGKAAVSVMMFDVSVMMFDVALVFDVNVIVVV